MGSNGCGKTTFLNLVLGIAKPTKGSIRVFQKIPGKQYLASGHLVGYMPQEIALISNFTIEENMIFFAKLFNINSRIFAERFKYLSQTLELCDKNRRIDQLSGGQQRLVSMAVAIIHSPKLIILDEPTVGLDSMLRNKIWFFLENICQQNGCIYFFIELKKFISYFTGNTVIITTHYIEEAKRASTVAFMKSGAILRQSNPQKLMDEFQSTTLEEVYLNLWTETNTSNEVSLITQDFDSHSTNREHLDKKNNNSFDFFRIQALIWMEYLKLKKLALLPVLSLGMPLIAIYLVSVCAGTLPHDIPVAIYSEEKGLSTNFINSIKTEYMIVTKYDRLDLAVNSIVKGFNTMAIVFTQNFTEQFESRLLNPLEYTYEDSDNSVIRLYIDNTRPALIFNALQYFAEIFHQFVANVSIHLDLNPNAFDLPIKIEETIYGSDPLSNNTDKYNTNSNNLAPAVLLNWLHFASLIMSSYSLSNSRSDTYIKRFLVSGGQPIEVLFSHFIILLSRFLIQMIILLIIANNIFDIKQEGSFVEVYAICVLQILQGLSLGLMIAAFTKRKEIIVVLIN